RADSGADEHRRDPWPWDRRFGTWRESFMLSSDQACSLMVIQESWVINQRPNNILSDCQTLIFQLFLAQLHPSAHFLQFTIGWDRRLGGGQLSFELLRMGIFIGRLLGGCQSGLKLRELLILFAELAEEELAIAISPLVLVLGNDGRDRGREAEFEWPTVCHRN